MTTDVEAVPQRHIDDAVELLALVRRAFDAASGSLARACASGGRLDAGLLDAQQIACFDLAWAAADLVAAETAAGATGFGRAGASALDRRLSLLFCAEAIPRVLDRLDAVALEGEPTVQPLHALRTDPRLRSLRAFAASGPALRIAGRGVARADGEIGRVDVSESQAMAQEAFRRFSRDVVAPLAEGIHRGDLTVSEAILRPLREMGVFGLSVPERFGGSAADDGDDALLMVLVTEALSEGSLAAAGSLITRPEILTRALLAGGTEEQRAHWLPRIAAGDPLCAIAITEPDYGSDVASLSLRATRSAGGWRLSGAKTWCTFAGKAGVLMVVARTDPDRSLQHKGLSVFLVEKPSFDGRDFSVRQPEGGTLTGRAIATIGYRGMHSFDLAFDDFLVPDSDLLGGEAGLGQGFYVTMAGMAGGRLQTAARACGVMRAALRSAVRYCGERRVFGGALLDFALTEAKLARMAALYAACRQLACHVAARPGSEVGRMDASLVKLLACRSAEIVTREAMQLHGGMGYAEESAVSRYFVDARVLSIFEGAEETLALKVVAKTLLEKALQG